MHETETNLRKEIDDKQNEREDEEFLNTISVSTLLCKKLLKIFVSYFVLVL